jgi:nucleotide-binding universal stress UspA family protein
MLLYSSGRIIYGGSHMGIVNLKKIMIATDGSTCSMLAAYKGIELARLSKGTVYAVYVISTAYITPVDRDYFSSTSINPYYESMYEVMHEAMKKQGQQAVEYIKGLGDLKDVKVEPVLIEGNPSEELIRYAEEEKMDLIIMGTVGKKGLDRLLLGSVTGNIVRHSDVPVMVIREECK